MFSSNISCFVYVCLYLYMILYIYILFNIFYICPNGIFDPWVRWDGGLDSARNSSAAAAVAAAAVTKNSVI